MNFEVKFSTYAVPVISGEIKRFLRDDGMVKVSRTLKENGIRIKRAAEMLAIQLGRDATLEELSAATELAREDIVMALEAGSEVESLHKTVFQKEGSEILLTADKFRFVDSWNTWRYMPKSFILVGSISS